MRKLIDNTVSMLSQAARRKQLELLSFVEPSIPLALQGDPGRLQQVLMNFTNNAIKFTNKGAVVLRVELKQQGPGGVLLRFSVEDNGVGIPPDRMDRLFKCFSQVDPSTTRKHGGTGLGLAICKQLAALMGAQIGVESASVTGCISIENSGFAGVFLGHFQHCWPIQRGHLHVGQNFRHRDSVHPVARRDIQHADRPAARSVARRDHLGQHSGHRNRHR